MKIKTALTPAPIAPLGARLGYTLVCLILYFSGLGNRWGKVRLPRVFHADVERLVLPLVFSKEEKDLQFNLYGREGWFGGRGIVGNFKVRVTFPQGGIKFTCQDLWDFNPGAFDLQKWKGLMVFVHLLEKWTGLKELVREDRGDSIVLDESLLGSLNSTHEFSHEWKLEYSPKELEELRNQFVQLLRAGWGKERKVKLSGADLSGADLSGADLTRADLSGADLSGADLQKANLKGADLRGTNLSGADLGRANLLMANLSGANLVGACLKEANLRMACLNKANLTGANLGRANLEIANLVGADLTGADLKEANLQDVNLQGADLSGADLSGADLRYADLEGALLP